MCNICRCAGQTRSHILFTTLNLACHDERGLEARSISISFAKLPMKCEQAFEILQSDWTANGLQQGTKLGIGLTNVVIEHSFRVQISYFIIMDLANAV